MGRAPFGLAPHHRSWAVATLLDTMRALVEVVPLPPYAPDSNPDKWAGVGAPEVPVTPNNTAPDTLSLQRTIRRAARRMRCRPALIRWFLRPSELVW